jgi:hypothetical protein
MNREDTAARVVRDAAIVAEVVVNGRTLQSVGDQYGLTRERVRQIVKAGAPKFHNREVSKARTRARRAAARSAHLAEGEKYRTSAEESHQISESTRRWTEDTMLEALRRVQSEVGHPLAIAEWRKVAADHDAPSAALYIQRFGTWNRAKELAGLQPIKTYRSSYVREYEDIDLIHAVAQFLRTANRDHAGQRFGLGHYERWRKDGPHRPSAALIRVRLGRWHEVKEAAIAHNKENFDES